MKNIRTILVTLLVALSTTAFCQIGHGGTPPSFKYGGEISAETFPINVDWNTIKAEDDYTRTNKFPTRIGFNIPINKGLNDVGKWSQLPDGRMMWQYEIELEGAQATSVIFDKFNLPESGELYLYDVNKNVVLGAFTAANNNVYNMLSTQLLPGSRVVVEYIEEPNKLAEIDRYRSLTDLNIGEALYVYNPGGMFSNLDIEGSKPYTGSSEWCEVNINCSPEGDKWQTQKRGAVALVMPSPEGVFVCSGSMVNDAINSGIQYLLTAFHCGENTTDKDKLKWLFYFNYEYEGCANKGHAIENHVVSGCELVSEANVNKGGSDHLLIRLLNKPEPEWNVYYNGWDASSTPSTAGVGIHHPNGDVTKISTYTSTLTPGTFNSGMRDGFWSVKWAQTTNGFGVTEGGSSGSPLFNTDGLIIGTLTGGGSYCDNTNGRDLYGRMDKHWTSNGTAAGVQLKPWLDPLNKNITIMSGLNPKEFVAELPEANFRASNTTTQTFSSIKFENLTSNMSTSWEWTFEGGTPSSSTDRDPSVTYDKVGTYSVTLKSKNSAGENTTTKTGYITVTPYQGEYLTIGTGVRDAIFPLGSLVKYERSASIYKNTEIASAGAITSLGWFTNTTKKTKIIKIYMKYMTQTHFGTNGDEWKELMTDAQLVFNDTIVTTNKGWTNIGLSSVFQYDGTSNLMILVEQNNSTQGSTRCQYTTKTAMHQTWSGDDLASIGVGTRDNNLPNINILIYKHNLTPTVIINKTVVAFDNNVHQGDVKITPETLTHTEKYRINGETEWIDAVSAIGNYDIQVSVNGNAEYNSLVLTSPNALVIEKQVSINETTPKGNIKIYPNPATNSITVDGENITEIIIYDLSGMAKMRFNHGGQLNLSQLHNGIYSMLIMTISGEQRVEKIIIDK